MRGISSCDGGVGEGEGSPVLRGWDGLGWWMWVW